MQYTYKLIRFAIAHRLAVTFGLCRAVDSREMLARVVVGQSFDFFFSSGVVAANQIADAAKLAKMDTAIISPFFTPTVIAYWASIVQILAANGVTKESKPKSLDNSFCKANATHVKKSVGKI